MTAFLRSLKRDYKATWEAYKETFGVDCFDAVTGNLLSLLKTNEELGSPVDVTLGLRQNKGFDYKATELYSQISEYVPDKHMDVFDDKYDNWAGYVAEEDIPRGHTMKPQRDKTLPCYQYYNGLTINSEGYACICDCRDFDSQLKVGNINFETLEEIWYGDLLGAYRENWMAGSLPEQEQCRKCCLYMPYTENAALQQYYRQRKITSRIKNTIKNILKK